MSSLTRSFRSLAAQFARPAGLEPLVNNLYLIVPSFLNSGKLQTSLAAREEEVFMTERYL